MSANLPRPSTEENVSSTLSSGITDIATTITIGDASKLVAPTYLVIDRVDSAGALKTTSAWEYVKVTNIAGNDLTVTRGVNNSTNQSHSAGAVIEAVVTSAHFEDWYTTLNTEHDGAGGHVIVGTMTVAGMNLASVATVASAGMGIVRVITHLNASGASVNGVFTTDPFNINRLGVTSAATINYLDISTRANFASLASVPRIARVIGVNNVGNGDIGNNVVIQRAIISGVSVAGTGIGTYSTPWRTGFSSFFGGWVTIDNVTNQTNMISVQMMAVSNNSIAGTKIQNNAGGDETGATIEIYGLGTV